MNSDHWLEVQQQLTRGQIRLYPAQDLYQAAEFIKVVIENLTNTSKLDIQKEYFKSVCLFFSLSLISNFF
jgi:pyrroloquinoline quinone (PQQ) biosynthesis protein C